MVGAKEIAHQGRVLATKLDDLSLISGVNMVEGENRPLKLASELGMCIVIYMHAHSYVGTQ